jgi:hypothetical protein
MIVKNKKTAEDTPADRAFWAHCEAVAGEVSLWPGWMRGETGDEAEPLPDRRKRFGSCLRLSPACRRRSSMRSSIIITGGGVREAEKQRVRSENDEIGCFHVREQTGPFPYLIVCFQRVPKKHLWGQGTRPGPAGGDQARPGWGRTAPASASSDPLFCWKTSCIVFSNTIVVNGLR